MMHVAYGIEKFLCLSLLTALLVGSLCKDRKKAVNMPEFIVTASLAAAAVLSYGRTYSQFISFMICAAAFVVFLFSKNWLAYKKFKEFEFSILYLASVIGMLFAVETQDFLTLFLALETVQAGLVFLTGYKRYGVRSTQTAMRFALVGLVGTLCFLFGIAIVYGVAGGLSYETIASVAQEQGRNKAFVLGTLFLFLSVLIKLGAVPLSTWHVDVIEGAPSPVSAFIGTVWRLCLIFVLAQWVVKAFAPMAYLFNPLLSFCGVLSVFVGSKSTVSQTNVKRLTAFTVMAGNGFALIALAAADMSALLFLLISETVLYAGLFAVVLSMRIQDELSEDMDSLRGKGRNSPLRGALYSMIFIGLTGLPPFAGFWSRYFLFRANVMQGSLITAGTALCSSAFLAYAYLKLVRLLYEENTVDDYSITAMPMRTMIYAAAFVSVFLIVWVVPLSTFIAGMGF